MAEKMKAVMKTEPKPGGTEFRTVEVPKLKPNDVLIKTKIVSICGTDVHIYDWNAWAQRRIKVPRIYGHEFAGEVIKVGENVKSVKVGDYVSGECHIACGHCYNCQTGLAHICENTQIFGVDIDGIFAEYACIPETNAWKNAPELPLEFATIQDPLGNAIHTVFSADVPGHSVAVIGCGPIGLMSVDLCRMLGASQIFAIGRKNEYRLNLAKELGATRTIKSSVENPVEIILNATNGRGADVVLEMSGSAVALNQGFKYLRPGGSMHILALYAQDIPIDVTDDIVFKYARVYGINGRLMFKTWHRMAGLLKSGRLNLKTIITHKFKFDEFEKAMQLKKSGNSGKVVLYM